MSEGGQSEVGDPGARVDWLSDLMLGSRLPVLSGHRDSSSTVNLSSSYRKIPTRETR